MDEEILGNGIDALTGRYLPVPGSAQEFAQRAVRTVVSPADLREMQWKLDRTRKRKGRRSLSEKPFRRPIPGVDPLRLDSAGWCVIFAPGTAGIRDRMRRLLEHREKQAGGSPLYKVIDYSQEKPAKRKFLQSQDAPQGQPDPAKLPYYVLLVGDPRTISFRFQYELDVQYAVGRLWLERPEDYERYADAVVDAETGEGLRPRRLTFFGVSNDDDPPTQRLRADLIEPLSRTFQQQHEDWEVRAHFDLEAKKEHLRDLLGGPETPALLVTGCHGLGFGIEEKRLKEFQERQLAEQGALICQDWPGPVKWKGELLAGHYFTADDLRPQPDLRGLIAFQFACYSGGTPEVDNFFADNSLGMPRRLALEPFVARLPQRLLAGGALAVLAHVDRAWTTTFSPEGKRDPQVFESTLKSLLAGEPLGWATEYLNQRYAELASELSHQFEDQAALKDLDAEDFLRVWRATNDARNFVVLGDPAVRLAGSQS
ncbi:MAG TPA: hypothetical protein VF789_33575 [Thermoanaerobaculia bacterium]